MSQWQYVSTTIVAPEGKEDLEIVNICVVCAYETNGNFMIFDDLSLVREAAQTMKYDEDGNLVKVSTTGVDPDTNTYDSNNGNLTEMTTADGNHIENTYDTTFVHRLVSTKDTGTGLTQTLVYDNFGNVETTTVTSANGSKIQTASEYSTDGNLLMSVTDAVGNTVNYTYSSLKNVMMGLPTTITDGNGVDTSMEYDEFGRTKQTSVENGGSLVYTYTKGMLASVARNSQTYNFTYDVWGNMTRAEVGSWILGVYTYGNKNGQLSKQTFANGDHVSYTYDDLGRTKTVTWSDGRVLHYAYTGDGQLYSISDSATGKTQYYHYDGLGRLVNSYQVSTAYAEGEKPIRSDYTYNAEGRLTRWEYYTPTTGKAYMTYTYDTDAENAVSNGLLTSLRMVNGQNIGYTYDSLQRLLDKGVTDGFWEQYSYAPGKASGTTSTQVSGLTNWMGQSKLHTFSYTYDGNGNITRIADGRKGTDVSYTYDVQNQLKKAVHSNGRTENYTYDTAGNILTFNNGTNSHTYTYGDTYGWKDLLTKVDGQSITYDNSGNPTSYYNGYRYTMDWTEGRKLASVTYNNQATTYAYNHEGLRTKQTYRDGTYILYEIVDGVYVGETRYNANGSVQLYMRYILDEGNSPVGISLWYPNSTSWTDYYFVKNLQGDVLEVYKASDNTLAASYTYDSWGNPLSKSGTLADINPFRYRSYYFDEQTWFYYLQSRYYDPAIGRFLNADIFASTGQGVLGYNMFAYCLNNPANNEDPLGLYVVPDDPLRGPVWMHLGGNSSGVSSASPSGGPNGFSLPLEGLIQSIINFFQNQEKDDLSPPQSQKYNYNGRKTEAYVKNRGWTDEMIRYAMKNGKQGTTINVANNNAPSTAYQYPGISNQYVVIDNSTGSIVQVSDFYDSGWKVDPRIQWSP